MPLGSATYGFATAATYTSGTANPSNGEEVAIVRYLQATAHASGIQVIRDDAEASILRLNLEPNKVEWVAFNPLGKSSKLESRKSARA